MENKSTKQGDLTNVIGPGKGHLKGNPSQKTNALHLPGFPSPFF